MSVKNLSITKESVTRLLKDVKHIMKNPLTENGIYYIHDEEDMLKGYALIIGPEDTPYFGGNYFFEFSYPTDYPHSPPKLTYCTNGDGIRFNPNLYKCGKVCVSVLNTWRGPQWTSCQTISTILLTLCTLLSNDPLLNEPNVTKTHSDFHKYNLIIEHKNVDVAVVKMVEKDPSYYPAKFELFYPYVKENFIKNREKITALIEKRMTEQPEVETLKTGLYAMIVPMDYKRVYDNLQKIELNK